MKFSTKNRYALRLMIDLAKNNTGNYISLKDISKRQDISVKYLEQIVNQLNRIGYLKSVRGPQGGYRLAKPASEYTAGDILRAIEGTLAPVSCLEETSNLCPRRDICPSIRFWVGLQNVIEAYVDNITLDQLALQEIDYDNEERPL